MAGSMKLIAKRCFLKAIQTIDRFHVQKLASEALQDIRIQHRWEALEQENEAILQAKKLGESYLSEVLSNGDTKKQLLARSRHLLYKSPNNWSENQKERAAILFTLYPDIQKAYSLTNELRQIFNLKIEKPIAMIKLAHWIKYVEESGFKSFNTLLKTFLYYSL